MLFEADFCLAYSFIVIFSHFNVYFVLADRLLVEAERVAHVGFGLVGNLQTP